MADFERRDKHLTGVPIADTALMFEVFAQRRGLTARSKSELLPAPGPVGVPDRRPARIRREPPPHVAPGTDPEASAPIAALGAVAPRRQRSNRRVTRLGAVTSHASVTSSRSSLGVHLGEIDGHPAVDTRPGIETPRAPSR
jgi:hypothetical protein